MYVFKPSAPRSDRKLKYYLMMFVRFNIINLIIKVIFKIHSFKPFFTLYMYNVYI